MTRHKTRIHDDYNQVLYICNVFKSNTFHTIKQTLEYQASTLSLNLVSNLVSPPRQAND
jgi:hypothetical protein